MKYLGSVTDPKDVATKEYVDANVKPPHKQSFTATAASTVWAYEVPIDTDNPPTAEEVANFNAYHYHNSNGVPLLISMDYYSTSTYTSDGVTYLRYIVAFYRGAYSGYTIVFENSFTDTDGILKVWM